MYSISIFFLFFISVDANLRRRHGEILWINATFQAQDVGLNFSVACRPLKEYWDAHKNVNETVEKQLNGTVAHSHSMVVGNASTTNVTVPDPILWIHNKSAADQFSVNTSLLELHEAVAINLGRVCLMEPRVLWINRSSDARQYGLNTTIICVPFRSKGSANSSSVEETLKALAQNDTTNGTLNSQDAHRRVGRDAKIATPITLNQSAAGKGLQLNFSEEPILFVKDALGAEKLNLDSSLLESHESVGIDLMNACKELQTVAAFNASEQLGVNVDQNIGIDVSAIDANLEDLQEKATNDTRLDSILKQTNESAESARMLSGSYILPILKKANYDKYTAPAIFENQTVVVKVGFYVESISDFDSESMDYDMDIYFRMAWSDPRLASSKINQTINIKEQDIRDQLWLPDAYFPNAKEADFHQVTFLNFVLHVWPDGSVFYMIRIKLKPSCHLVLCKFPHDVQTCSLRIQSFAYPIDQLKFEWFNDLDEAIELNKKVVFSELSVAGRSKAECDGLNRIGNFTCLIANFNLQRDLGYYIAQTYVPTTLALMFSWVGVWLPEELMEGRLGVAITVLLTLSTDSVSSQEHLPTVSYMKAIDIWFAFITAFVFLTMIQSLFVIGFDRKALTLRKRASRKYESNEDKETLETAAERYHKIGRYLDQTCRLAYPLIFACFCVIYFLVITQGTLLCRFVHVEASIDHQHQRLRVSYH